MIPEPAAANITLPALSLRGLPRRAAVPGAAVLAVAFVVLASGHTHTVTQALQRALHAHAAWALAAVGCECLSLAGYVALLSLVGGAAAPRIGVRESTQITLAGAAATRLLPTAGAGGAALTVWALRRAGLHAGQAARALLTFFVLLYAVFLGAIAAFGMILALSPGNGNGPLALSAIPAAVAALAIVLALGFALPRPGATAAGPPGRGRWRSRLRNGPRLIGLSVHDACTFVRAGRLRVLGAAAYWAFDAAVLWMMLRAFGTPPPPAVVGLAYLVGQVANTLPLPGSVSGGIAGVLIAFHVPAGLALPAVLAYRTVAVWLPTPAALSAVPGLRTTVLRWASEDAARA